MIPAYWNWLSITKDKLLATSYDLLHDPILSDYWTSLSDQQHASKPVTDILNININNKLEKICCLEHAATVVEYPPTENITELFLV